MLDYHKKHGIEINDINMLLNTVISRRLHYTRSMLDVIEETIEWVITDDETLCVTSIGFDNFSIIGEIVTIDADSGELTDYNFSVKF
jgi:hypothetical protein